MNVADARNSILGHFDCLNLSTYKYRYVVQWRVTIETELNKFCSISGLDT